MIRRIVILLIILTVSMSILGPVAAPHPSLSEKTGKTERYTGSGHLSAALINAAGLGSVFVGGQNGTWFGPGQFPRLYEVYLQNDSDVQLAPVRGEGTVWGGGFNGSQLLISGWGTDDDTPGPYICLYNGANVVTEGSLDDYGQASSWSGGDIFDASYNGREWLLTGLGSGPEPPYYNGPANHMSLGTFDGSFFTDLSNLAPDQRDAILYTNAWNGEYWLVGGGYKGYGTLFTFDGNTTVDLTTQAKDSISNFASVQSIGWNGAYWLIGGMGFLAQYDGRNFVDLTQQLEDALGTNNFYSVNAIAWNGQSWMIGGGTPVAQLAPSQAWVAAYTSSGFADLSSALPTSISNASKTSSILAITSVNELWMLGGYSGNQGTLLTYFDGSFADYSDLVTGMSYVSWVSGLGSVNSSSVTKF